MAKGKIRTVVTFVRGLQELRTKVKEDAKRLLATLDLATLSDEEALASFLEEMVITLSAKHLLSGSRIRPEAAALIRAYVVGMMKP